MIARPQLIAPLGVSMILAMTAAAAADTVVATCAAGGCQCSLSSLSPDEITLFLGEDAGHQAPGTPVKATLVYEPELGLLTWVDAPRRDIQAAFGGAGDCPVAPAPAPEAMVPRDGTWQWQTLAEATSGCPAVLGGMVAASRVEFVSTQIAWGGAFHPGHLAEAVPHPELEGIAPYAWRQVGPDRWLSDNVRDRDCTDGACVDIALRLTMALVAPDRISGLFSLQSAVDAPHAAIRAGFGLGECKLRVRYDIIRTGP